MQLSSRMFAELVTSATGGGARSVEQRRAPRVALHAKVELTLIDLAGRASGPTYSAVTRDVSLFGVGLLQSARMERGQKFLLILPRKPNRSADSAPASPVRVRCTVVRCEQMTTSMFNVGAEFEEFLDDEANESRCAAGDGTTAPKVLQPAAANE